MFRISSTDRTGNWLGGTVVKGVLSKSLDLKYVLPNMLLFREECPLNVKLHFERPTNLPCGKLTL